MAASAALRLLRRALRAWSTSFWRFSPSSKESKGLSDAKPSVDSSLSVNPNQNSLKKGESIIANAELGTTQQETATANFTDAEGAAVLSFPAPPVWLSSNPAALSVTPAADGMTAVLAGVGTVAALGVVVTCTATNPDNTTDQLSISIDVVPGVAGDAVGGSISLGTPSAQGGVPVPAPTPAALAAAAAAKRTV
jgi:hypothetical protein